MGDRAVISLAKDFSRHPGPRLRTQGRHSGQQFREDVLLKKLSQHEHVVVDLDGTSGIGSSFIDEAFGGLIFASGMDSDVVKRRVSVVSRLDETYLLQFDDSVTRAEPPRR